MGSVYFDSDFGILYVRFANKKIAKTVEHTPFIYVDFNAQGEFAGIEFIGVRSVRPGLDPKKSSSRNLKETLNELNAETDTKNGKVFIELERGWLGPTIRKSDAELAQILFLAGGISMVFEWSRRENQ